MSEEKQAFARYLREEGSLTNEQIATCVRLALDGIEGSDDLGLMYGSMEIYRRWKEGTPPQKPAKPVEMI